VKTKTPRPFVTQSYKNRKGEDRIGLQMSRDFAVSISDGRHDKSGSELRKLRAALREVLNGDD
jgi:hypothetical protein